MLCYFAYLIAVSVHLLLIQILYYEANCSTDVILYCIEYEFIFFLSHYIGYLSYWMFEIKI